MVMTTIESKEKRKNGVWLGVGGGGWRGTINCKSDKKKKMVSH